MIRIDAENDAYLSAMATATAEPLVAPPDRGCIPPARTVAARATAARRLRIAISRPEVRSGFLSLVDQAAVSGASFLTSVIIGRMCSKEDLGIFYLALTIVYLARGIQEQIVSSPYAIYCHRREDQAAALYAGSSLLHYLMLSGAILVALAGFLGVLSVGMGPLDVMPTVWVLMGALPLLLLREFIRRLACAHLEMATATIVDTAVAVFQLGGLLLLAHYHLLTVNLAYGVMAAACALACCGWFFAKRMPLTFSWPAAVADWHHNWGFARWALASHLVNFAAPTLLPWIVTAVNGSAEAGAFAACVGIVGTASMFMTGLATYLIPKAAKAFAHGGADELRPILRTAALIFAVVLGAFTLLVFAAGDHLLVLAFGPKYAGYGTAVGVLALGMAALSMGLTAGIGLWAIDRPEANLLADVCSLVVTLAILCCILQPLGLLGAALADLGGKVAGATVRYETLRRLLKTTPCRPAVQ
jgi:O-antigen/teichoic acid export membrane protein